MKIDDTFRKGLARLCFSALSFTAAAAFADGLPQRVIVKYAENDAQDTAFLAQQMTDSGSRHGVSMRRVRTMSNGAQVMTLSQQIPASELSQMIDEMAATPGVEYAEEDKLMKPAFTPNDPRYNEQWHYYESRAGLNLPTAWNTSTGKGVIVAVIDTGYRPHADLAANIVGGYDFISDPFVSRDGDGRDADARDAGDFSNTNDCGAGVPGSGSSWHGTHVSGTIAARTNNGLGVAGVAFNARVLPVRVLGRCGGFTSDIADGLVWAAGGTVNGVPKNLNPAKVANLSLGGGGPCGNTMQNAINSARQRGMVVVVAAGNENQNAANASPANCKGVVTVAAIGRDGGRAPYSNFGALVDVAAPGGNMRTGTANGVLSTLNAGATTPGADSYAFYQGTSMATPHVAGVAALVLALKPSFTPDQVESILKNTARAFPAQCNQCGTGIVNAAAAVRAAGR